MYGGGSAGSLYSLSPESTSLTEACDRLLDPCRAENARSNDSARDCRFAGAYHGARDTSSCTSGTSDAGVTGPRLLSVGEMSCVSDCAAERVVDVPVREMPEEEL